MVERHKILEAVRTAIESAPERKFSESVDLTVNLKNIDMAQPKNRIDETILLPQGTGRPVGIAVLGKGEITTGDFHEPTVSSIVTHGNPVADRRQWACDSGSGSTGRAVSAVSLPLGRRKERR